MRKTVLAIIAVILLLNIVEVAFLARPVKAYESPDTLEMTTLEDISVLRNGSSTISILMNISSGPLADLYRKVLNAPSTVCTEAEIPIQDSATQDVDANGDATTVSLPVVEEFYESIMKEQLLSFGLRTEIVGSEIIPQGITNECRIMVNAIGAFEILKATNNESNQVWEIALGPFNTTGITGLILTRLMFAQMMLQYIPGTQIYQNSWHLKVHLPTDAVLLNPGLQYNWEIDFGGGTYLNASASLDDGGSILVDEKIVITENNVTSTPEYLANALSTYKTFKVEYSLTGISTVPDSSQQSSLNTNWSHNGDTGWVPFPDISLPLNYADSEGNSLDLRLIVSPTLRLMDDIGWQFYYDLNFPFVHLDKFWGLLNLSASIGVRLEANASLVIYQDSWTLYHMRVIKSASFYGVPVIIYIDFTIDANLLIKGNMSFVANAVISGEIDAGVRWTHTRGWEPVFVRLASANITDFTWRLAVGISITPGLSFRVEFLFYGVAGPFVEFLPYLNIEETSILPDATIIWDMSLNFDINAGVTINGWLRSILGLSDWNWLELSINIWHYNGSWTIGPQPTPHEPSHDLQLASLKVSPPVIIANNSALVNVMVRNIGDYNETSELALYQNDSMIESPEQFNISSGETLTFSFNWNSSTLMLGSYALKGAVTPVLSENNTADNEMSTIADIVANNDIAVINMKFEPNDTYEGRTVNITVAVQNFGELVEDSNVTVSANDTVIDTLPINGMQGNQTIELFFLWNTSSQDPGKYVIWANVSALHYDINMANNELASEENMVKLRILGDLDGNNIVNVYDCIIASPAFSSKRGDLNYNTLADLVFDGTVDIFDFIMICVNFGRTQS